MSTRSEPDGVAAAADARIPPDWPLRPDWPEAATRLIGWWEHRGLAVRVTAPRDTPLLDVPAPVVPDTPRARWIDPVYKPLRSLHHIAHTFFGGEAIAHGDMCIGAGDLAAMMGCGWDFADRTVWFEPCLTDEDVEADRSVRLDRQSDAFIALRDLTREHLRVAEGRYPVGLPDLVENYDILAAMRGNESLIYDAIDRPGWVARRIDEINDAFFDAFDDFYERVKDSVGGNVFSAFELWGPGKTAKVQCDAGAMLSPSLYKELVVPALTRQCEWLDYAMFHLDGDECLVHLDALLEIEPLQAIEWTPKLCWQDEGGGNPKWYDLYRRILDAGKSVQAIQVAADEVIPLLDAVGGRGMSIFVKDCETEAQARSLLERIAPYREGAE